MNKINDIYYLLLFIKIKTYKIKMSKNSSKTDRELERLKAI